MRHRIRMKTLLSIRNSVESFYRKHSMLIGYFLRLIFTFGSLLILTEITGYNSFLSQTWFIALISVAGAFMPMRAVIIMQLLYITAQIGTMSIGIGAVILIILLILYMLYFRLNGNYAFALVLMAVLAMIRLPLLVPLVLALVAPVNTVIAAVAGNIVYYLIRYVSVNEAVFKGMEGGETLKAANMIRGFFSSYEFLYSTAVIVIVFFIVYYLKKANINNAMNMAGAVGAGAYVILTILAQLIFSLVTSQRLIWTVVGALISLLLALLTANIILPLDFKRTELAEFEDEEYHYFVKAVPKAVISRERVYVKRINRRREAAPAENKNEES